MAEHEEQVEELGKEWYFALAFLMGSDQTYFRHLLKNLENEYTQGHDNYPKMQTAAYNHLVECKQDPQNMMQMTGGNDGISFATQGDLFGSQEDQQCTDTNPSTTTTTDGAAAGHSFTAQGGPGQERGSGQGWNSGPPTCYKCGAVGHLQPTAQKHLRMWNGCWKHPNNMSTNQTSKEHNVRSQGRQWNSKKTMIHHGNSCKTTGVLKGITVTYLDVTGQPINCRCLHESTTLTQHLTHQQLYVHPHNCRSGLHESHWGCVQVWHGFVPSQWNHKYSISLLGERPASSDL